MLRVAAIVLCVSAATAVAQVTDSLHADITRRRSVLMLGYVYQGVHALRLGLGRVTIFDHVYPGKYAASWRTSTLSFGADLHPGGARFIVAPTLSWHVSLVWLMAGVDLAYVSDFRDGNPLLRFNLGIGLYGSRICYGWNVGRREVNGIDGGAFTLEFPITLSETIDTLRTGSP